MFKNLVVEVPSIKQPIVKSPGFAKKELATWKLDLMALCGFGCRYCSSNTGNYLRINRDRFATLTQQQTGRRLLPSTTPELAMVWPDVLAKLEAQVKSHPKSWGEGETLVLSMLTDAFSGPPLESGTTRAAIDLLLAHTSFRIRVLTKNSVVGTSEKWRNLFSDYRDRFVVGLSIGTLDPEFARAVEIGTPPPAARITALHRLQDAGVPTFGMLCPIFPYNVRAGALDDLVSAIRPAMCETVWAEPFNDRDNWRVVRDGFRVGSNEWDWFGAAFDSPAGDYVWSSYATGLYYKLRQLATDGGWMPKLKYLLYEGGIIPGYAHAFVGLNGVLLQDPTDDNGRSNHPSFAKLQQELSGTFPPKDRP